MKLEPPPAPSVGSVDSFLAELLAEQSRLDTPVARFAREHDAVTFPARGTSTARLLPLSTPGPGEQYAFEVDLDSCTGCKSCVAACHALNGLDDTETWRDVGTLVSANPARAFTQTVTTACHHCADPACLNGCPVLAYEKDPLTGIVRHLDDQCIGCSYCILKCPYDVPKYSDRLGIVRKCDLCHGRLAAGEAPACAQACPTQAIRIVTRPVAASDAFLPTAPTSDYTQPTTRYVSKRPLPENLVPGDAATLRVQPAHAPLAIMLTLLPFAVGCALLGAASAGELAHPARIAAAAIGAVGLTASAFHLGQPLRAWRIFLGWRRSWLSREAMLFGAWLPLACAATAFPVLAWPSALVGAVALACSAMIYVDTRRHFWRAAQTFPRFFGLVFLVPLALTAPRAAALMLLLKLAWESRTYFDASMSSRLQRGPLLSSLVARDALGLAAVITLVAGDPFVALAPLLLGEACERVLFFRAVDAPKMPGVSA
jgi:Fe-S-cluster-containing dehydrogenase component/DMSO reductase anchor subunit